ncbi:DNA repair protein XRCC3-like [Amphiura filiformis]|uniref:DNA repair protein XRCC3-like n=1 Tax=Amphiura filiformis TaxID=82378 RepID=UPI003B2100C5
MDDLEINPRILSAVKKARLRTFTSILHLSASDLERHTGLSSSDIKLLLTAVSKEVYKKSRLTALDLYQGSCPTTAHLLKLRTGCDILDEFLGGGILSQGITEVAGESAAGKTQFCMQLCLTAQLPEDSGGLNGGAVYICTEDAFPSKRLQQLITVFNKRQGPIMANKLAVGDHIFVEHVSEMDQLWYCIDQRLPLLIAKGLVKLIVIDSLAALFRSEFDSGEMFSRAKQLQRFGGRLHALSLKHNIAVVCVNQVTANMRPSSAPGTSNMIPALGLTWSNFVNTRLMLKRTNYQLAPSRGKENNTETVNEQYMVAVRSMEIVFAPHLPNRLTYYVVDADGVKGLR